MEDIISDNLQLFSLEDLKKLRNRNCKKIDKLENQLRQLKEELDHFRMYDISICQAIYKKEHEELKKKYEKYIGKYYVRIKASTDLIYYHFTSGLCKSNCMRLFGTSVTPIDRTITSEDYFDIHDQYDHTNLLTEITKDEFDKQLQSVVEAL